MNKRKTFIFSILLCTVSLLTLNIGTASFLYFDNSSTSSEDFEKNESEPVAYIKEDTSKTYYLDIEEAIDDANSMVNSGASAATIVVIPGSVVRLNQNKTLRSGVDLLLPYSLDNGDINKLTTDVNAGNGFYPIRYMYGATYEGTSQKPQGDFATYAEYNAYSSDDFSDSSSSNISKYLSSSLIIEENVSLTISNNSQLVVFSQLGKAGAGISGFSSGYYSQVIMMKNSIINVNEGGIIDCRGYIKEGFKENPSINASDMSEITNNSVINNNGTIYSPFVIYDYAGGNATVAIYTSANECPFSSYDMPQIHPKINVSYTGSLKGRADVYTGEFTLPDAIKDLLENVGASLDIKAQHNACIISFCGSDASNIFKLDSSNASVKSKYSPALYFLDNNIGSYYGLTKSVFSSGRESNNGGTTLLSFNGNVSTNYLTMNISVIGHVVPITTNGIFFPVGYNYTLQFENGTIYFNNDIKFMPGSELRLFDADLNVVNKVVFYDSNFEDAGSVKYPKNKSASCLIDGTEINIQGNGAFCGYIQTNGNSTIKNLTSNISVASADSSGGTLSTGKIADLGILDLAAFGGFVMSGTWNDNVKGIIAKLAEGVSTKNITSTIRADVNSENNITTLYANSTYIADKGFNYFKHEATDITLNISLHVSSGGFFGGGDSITINVNVYSDSNKSNPIATKELRAENGWMSEGNATDKITFPMQEGQLYYGEIIAVADGVTVNNVSVTKVSDGSSVLIPGTYEFSISDISTSYNIYVSD